MTSIYFDPAQFVDPSEQEPRDQLIVNGRYMLPPLGDPTGKRRSLQRVTNLVKQLSDTEGLTKWKLRTAVIGLALDERLYDLATSLTPESKRDLDDLIEKAIDLGQAGPSGGNVTGTALHNYTDDKPGEYPIRVRDKWVPKVENYQRALHDKGLRAVPGLSERLVVSERLGTAGRLDDIYEDPFGTLRVGDRKSQKEFYTWWEIGAQLACYQGSDAMWNEDECRFEDMPKLADDYVHVAWMPLVHPSRPDGVTIYDLPLEDAREVLAECVRVRELRRGARSWGKERPDLDDFARIARDIRDAEGQDDLRRLAELNPALAMEGDPLNRMAAKRWEELAEVEAPEPVSVDIEQAAFIAPPLHHTQTSSVPSIPRDSPAGQQALVMIQASAEAQRFAQDLVTRHAALDHDVVTASIDRSHVFDDDMTTVTFSGPSLAVERIAQQAFDPSLFVAPAQDGAVPASPSDFECRYEGKWASEHPINISGQFHCMNPEPRLNPLAATTSEERKELRAQEWSDEDGTLRKPTEWAHRLRLEGFHISADSDGVWCKSMPLKTFRLLYAPEIALCTVIGDVTRDQARSRHEGVTVVELPELPSQEDVDNALMPTLDSVPLKIVKEIATRAGNSQTARGRVRLLNDIESNKPGYVKHWEALIPAVLAEWLASDGGPSDGSDGPAGTVRNTKGSKRQEMRATSAGPTTLTAYLASKGEGGPIITQVVAGIDTDEAATRDPADENEAIELTRSLGQRTEQVAARVQEFAVQVAEKSPGLSEQTQATLAEMKAAEDERQRNDASILPDGTLAGDRERIIPGTIAQVRQKYLNIVEGPSAGQHSILRLVQLAKEARDGHERAQVFEAITKFHRWTGAIAAEINQHYLDNGYATEDFDPYFEAQAIKESALPMDPDDPATAQDALHLLEGVTSRDQLTLMWSALSAKPYFQEQALQEALLGKMMTLKS